MNELAELEHILTDIDCLADTFLAIDIANQADMFELPQNSLSLPAQMLKTNAERARVLHEMLLTQKV